MAGPWRGGRWCLETLAAVCLARLTGISKTKGVRFLTELDVAAAGDQCDQCIQFGVCSFFVPVFLQRPSLLYVALNAGI